MALKEDWKKAGGFTERRERPAEYQIQTRSAFLFLKLLGVLVVVAAAEYFLCGAFFRFLRPADAWRLDGFCALAAPLLCYWFFRKLIWAARQEGFPSPVVAALFLAFSLLLGCFLRFSLQLANGLLDFSDPQTRVVAVTRQKTSILGGSLREGPNPEAHLVYYEDWDDPDQEGEILLPPSLYYFAGPGTPLALTYRGGFFHWPWRVDTQLLIPH